MQQSKLVLRLQSFCMILSQLHYTLCDLTRVKMVKLFSMDMQYNEFHKYSRIQKRPIKRNNFTYRLIIREVENILTGLKKNNVKILDYGCGVGTLVFYLSSAGNNLTGVDISPLSIKLCNRSAEEMNLTNRVKFSESRNFWKKLKSTNNKFDLIICSEVIEHVRNDTMLLRNLLKVLNKGGYIFLTTPSNNAPLFKMGVADSFDNKVGHLRRYDVESLISTFEKIGMRVENVSRVEGILRNSLFIIPIFEFFIKFLRGLLSDVVTFIDELTVPIFGESNIFIVAKKI